MARTRLPNGYGTKPKQNKDGRWRIDITISDDGENSRRKSVYGISQEEVIKKRDAVLEQLKNGCLVTSQADKLTFGEWLNEWMDTYKKGKVSNNTISSYDNCIRLWISESLKKTALKKIRHSALQKLINDLSKKYSGGTCSIVRVVLQQSLSVAVKNKYIFNNPANGLEAPPKGKKEVIPLKKEELNLLLADRKGSRHYLYYVLSVYSGARIGEVLGLSWNDVDMKNNIIHIKHSLKYNKLTNEYELGPTKTGKHRDIPILPEVVTVLKWHKAKQAEEKLKIGKMYNLDNMVFCDYIGEYLPIDIIQREFSKVVKSLNTNAEATPHTLRHTFVSQMISAGVRNMKLISEMVGHANINITLDTYGHLMPGDANEAIVALSKSMQDIAL